MRSAITPAIWHAFNAPLEGRVYCMYLDVKGLVTTGVGNLIDSVAAAVRLPWRRKDGALATPYQVSAEWDIVKHHQPAGRSVQFYMDRTDLRLDNEAIDKLVWSQVLANDAELADRFGGWRDWPADAQLAAHSMAWAAGAGWSEKFPKCSALLKALEFVKAGEIAPGDSGVVAADTPSGMRVMGHAECDLKTVGNPGVIPRNALNRLHYIAAGSSLAKQYPDVLHGPLTKAAIVAGWVPIT